jgi:hypothetical protein
VNEAHGRITNPIQREGICFRQVIIIGGHSLREQVRKLPVGSSTVSLREKAAAG